VPAVKHVEVCSDECGEDRRDNEGGDEVGETHGVVNLRHWVRSLIRWIGVEVVRPYAEIEIRLTHLLYVSYGEPMLYRQRFSSSNFFLFCLSE